MKIQLSSTLPFNPVQLVLGDDKPSRAVGQLQGVEEGREYRIAVFEFRHAADDTVHYLVDPTKRLFLDECSAPGSNQPIESAHPGSLKWITHEDGLTYKPYSFLVMNAIAQLAKNWDGLIYQQPDDKHPIGRALNSTMQIIDACVCHRFGLWVKVNGIIDQADSLSKTAQDNQLGWVPVT